MIKKLFFILITTLSVSITAQNSISATLNPSSSIEGGNELTINITYTTANADYKIYAGVELKNSDGTWASTVVEGNINPVSAGTDVPTSLKLTIPSSTTPTANLTGGQYYEIKIELQDESWSWIAGIYPRLTVLEATVTNSISATLDSNPVEAASDLTLNLTYSTANTDYKIYAGVELKNSDGTWASTVVEGNINPVSAGTDATTSLVLSIPSSTNPTADLTAGQYYEIKIELQDGDWKYVAGVYPILTIAAEGSLSLANLEKLPAVVYPNPAIDVLNVKHLESNKQFATYKVFDITGKKLLENTNLDTKNVNVSTLSAGIYFLQIDNYKPLKFIKE